MKNRTAVKGVTFALLSSVLIDSTPFFASHSILLYPGSLALRATSRMQDTLPIPLRASFAHWLEGEASRSDTHDDVQAGAQVDRNGSGGVCESSTVS